MKNIILISFLSYGCKTYKFSTHDVLNGLNNPNRYTTTSIDLIEYNEAGEALIVLADNYPVHPNCKRENSKKCFAEMLNNEAKKHFTNELAEEISIKGKFRMFCSFQLDATGTVKEISVRAPHPKLKKRGYATIKNIPKMYPYLKDNKSSNLIFNLTITYLVE